jgi:hypothetical protein
MEKFEPPMLRVFVLILTAAVCVGAGALAGPVGFASALSWPPSEVTSRDSVRLGIGWGVAGAMLAGIVVAFSDRRYLWVTAGISFLATFLLACVGIWLFVVSSLGEAAECRLLIDLADKRPQEIVQLK